MTARLRQTAWSPSANGSRPQQIEAIRGYVGEQAKVLAAGDPTAVGVTGGK